MTTYSSLLLHMFHVVVWEKERLLFIWEKRHIKKNTLEKFEKWLWLSLCMNLQFFNLTSVMHSVWKLFVFTFQNSKYFWRHFWPFSNCVSSTFSFRKKLFSQILWDDKILHFFFLQKSPKWCHCNVQIPWNRPRVKESFAKSTKLLHTGWFIGSQVPSCTVGSWKGRLVRHYIWFSTTHYPVKIPYVTLDRE